MCDIRSTTPMTAVDGHVDIDFTDRKGWIDNMGTGIMVGEAHTKGKKTEGYTTGTDPVTGKARKIRFVETETSKDEFKVEMFGPGKDGKEFKMMELVYKRAM